MKSKNQPQPLSLREFALWRASGEVFTATGESLYLVARKHKVFSEPSAEVVAIIELSHVIQPGATGPAVRFAALRNQKK